MERVEDLPCRIDASVMEDYICVNAQVRDSTHYVLCSDTLICIRIDTAAAFATYHVSHSNMSDICGGIMGGGWSHHTLFILKNPMELET